MAGRGRKPDPQRPRFGRVSEVIDDASRPISDLLNETNEQTAATLAAHAPDSPPAPVEAPKEPVMTTPAAPSIALVITRATRIEALATSEAVPAELVEYFTPEEWVATPTAQRVSAIEFILEESVATTEGLPVSFPVVKYPTSGSSFWEVPTPSGEPEALKALEGVVVYKQMVRVYYPFGQAVAKQPPTCASLDLIRPSTDIVEPQDKGKGCAACPWAQWGSGKNQDGTPSRGQACKQRLRVFLLRPGEEIPTLLSLPPSALKAFGAYALQLRQSKASLVAVSTLFGLADATSNNGTPFKTVTLKVGRRLRFVEMQQAAQIRGVFEQQMARRGIQVDEGDGDHPEDAAAPGTTEVIGQDGKVVA